MAVLCLVAFIAVAGTAIYWTLSILFFWLPMYYGQQWRAYIRSLAAGLTWLYVVSHPTSSHLTFSYVACIWMDGGGGLGSNVTYMSLSSTLSDLHFSYVLYME